MNTDRDINISITSGTIMKTMILIALFLFLYQIRDVVLVVLTAVVIASSIEPLTLWLGKKGVIRILSVMFTYGILTILFVGTFYFFIPSLLGDTANFVSALPRYLDTITVPGQDLAAQKKVAENLSEGVNTSRQAVQSFSQGVPLEDVFSDLSLVISKVSGGFTQTVSLIFGGILSFILIVVLSFYFAVQEDGVEKFLRVITPVKQEKYVISLWRRTHQKIGLWMQGQLLLAVLVGILVYLGLAVFGIKNALFLAVLAAIFETIPLFGPILSAIPAIAIAYADKGLNWAFVIVGLYLVIQQFENHLIYPLVVKKIVGIPPILVILALIVGVKLGGFLGLMLSVPVAAMFVEWIDDIQKEKIAQEHTTHSA
jgi:predicted PurR-regulated permease PerM